MLKEDDSREAVALRLETIRTLLGLSKRDFAAQAGLSEQAYNGYSNTSRPLSLESAKRFRKAYGLPLEFVLFGVTNDLPMRYQAAVSGSAVQ